MNTWIKDKLERFGDRVALRVASSPGATAVDSFSGADLIARAQELVDLQAVSGTRRVVLLLLPHCPELFLIHIGLVLAGQVPAILAWPTTRVDAEKYQRNLLHQLQRIPAQRLITLPRLAENLRAGLSYEVSALDTAHAAYFERAFHARFDPAAAVGSAQIQSALGDDVLFLQFSGGTTGSQKCVAVTHSMLEAQLRRLQRQLGFSETDSVVSWLPLYHDMGLIACLWLPLYCGAASLHFAASDWLMRPQLLLEFLQSLGGTFTWLPNFAFAYLAQRRRAITQGFDLAHVRAWINCSEPVRRSSMTAFAAAFSDCGVSATALQASYAMAENVFAVTQTDLGASPQCVPRTAVRHAAVAPNVRVHEVVDDFYVSSGRCLPDMQVRVVRGDGSLCPDDDAGEVHVHSPSLFSGYWSETGVDRRSLQSDGWYATGDYGFCHGGELFVIGRLKDVIIVGGQNIFPEDLETIAARVPGVRAGRVVAFGIDDNQLGTQTIAMVAEMSDPFEQESAEHVAAAIRALITACLGVAPRYVRVVPARWIVKSTAGKISRADTRTRFLQDLTVTPAAGLAATS